ncbi:MAG: glycogen debranching enzyme, partial [Thermodesulfobacteriota bacterium]|nr:glycogen debranching enzyme [Thermodesulfobacteriota bacterium]
VPMLLGGDEFRRTQKGNNNAYCQNNEISWYDWEFLNTHRETVRFTRELISFRKRHSCLRRTHFFSGQDTNFNGLPDVSWHGVAIDQPDWNSKSMALACLIDGSYPEVGKEDTGNDLYLIFNAFKKSLSFSLPKLPTGKKWFRVLDTSLPSPDDILPEGRELSLKSKRRYRTAPRSLVVLMSK